MEIAFLGGAKEIGSSCCVLKIGDKNIMIDAGIKVNEEGTESLPDLSYLDELRSKDERIDAIIITHAHLDHCGALPVVSKKFPEARIYCTRPTKMIIQVMLEDALKVARMTGLEFYDEVDIGMAVDKTMAVAYESTYPIAEGVSMVLLNAGHVLGSAGVLLQSEEGTVLYTGDYTTFGQRTLNSETMSAFLKDGVNVLITEATYGDTSHPRRRDEIEKMMGVIEETIQRGGRVLIPAFALGRAQEVILSIKDRKKKGYKVYVDGLIRKMNAIYKNMGNYLTKRCYNQIDELFYNEEIIEIKNEEERKKALESTEPCVIIASSGMLTGGTSPIYAEKLMGDEKSSIIIVGYQDEESPGRKLLSLAENADEEKEIEINGIKRRVKCRVEKCQLSAHADRNGIISFLETIKSDYIVLVHGDERALESIYKEISGNPKITAVVEIGERIGIRGQPHVYNIPGSAGKRPVLMYNAVKASLNKDVDEEIDADLLWEHLVNHGMGETYITTGDLMVIWYGHENKMSLSDEQRKKFLSVIRSNDHYLVDNSQLRVYVKSREEYEEETRPSVMEQNVARELIQKYLGEHGLNKISFVGEKIVLNFHAPGYARKCADIIEKLKQETNLEIEVSDKINSAYISKLISEKLLEAGIELQREPSYRGNYVLLKLGEGQMLEKAEKIVEEIKNETGIDIRIEGEKSRREPEGVRIEQNYARKLIEERINKEISEKEYRVNISFNSAEGRILLKFVSPEYGRRYVRTIEELIRQTGWDIEIDDSYYRQNVLLEEAKKIMAEEGIRKVKAGFNNFNNYVEVRIGKEDMPEDKKVMIKKKFEEKTGVKLEIKEI